MADDPDILNRVRVARLGIRYTWGRRWRELSVQAKLAGREWPGPADLADNTRTFMAVAQHNAITKISEAKTVDIFEQRERRFAAGQRLFPYSTPWHIAEVEETAGTLAALDTLAADTTATADTTMAEADLPPTPEVIEEPEEVMPEEEPRPEYVLRYRVVQFEITYPDSYRKSPLGSRKVQRRASVSLYAYLLKGEGTILATSESEPPVKVA